MIGVFSSLFLALSVLFLTLSEVKYFRKKYIEKCREKKRGRNKALNRRLQLKTTQTNLSITLRAKFDADKQTGTGKVHSSLFSFFCFLMKLTSCLSPNFKYLPQVSGIGLDAGNTTVTLENEFSRDYAFMRLKRR